MVKPKPKSKRTPVRLRHKIEKASAAKQKKQRKLSKKNPEWRSRIKKDPGIPNLFPYKDKILHEIEEKKRLKEDDTARRREEAKARRQATTRTELIAMRAADKATEDGGDGEVPLDEEMEDDGDSEEDGSNPIAALLASAKARAAEYQGDGDSGSDDEMDEGDVPEPNHVINGGEDQALAFTELSGRRDTSRKAFDKVFKQVVEAADVVLYVLDARDPEGTRSKEVERMVMAAEGGNKRLILVLNKIDLIPPTVLKSWLLHLRRYFPTLPLRASNPAPNAHTFDHRQLTIKGSSETLFKALKSYAHSKQLKRSISVGVIGYPNVGKSSVINALTSRLGGGASACPAGAEAGVTTSLREVKLDHKLKLLDSPGIIFPSSIDGSKASRAEEQARLVLLNAVPPKQIDDPISAVSLLLRRLSTSPDLFGNLLEVYGLAPLMASNGDNTTDFLVQVARKRGRLGKGGVPNINSAAMTVITDWRDGRIQGWIEAPTLTLAPGTMTSADDKASGLDSGAGVGDHKEIVSEWAKEFHLEGLWGDEGINSKEEAMIG